jgi:hypothetical protein
MVEFALMFVVKLIVALEFVIADTDAAEIVAPALLI